MTEDEILMLLLLAPILLTQSLFLFTDARKRGHKYWFWGIWGLIQSPLPIIFYFIFARKIFRKKEEPR
ncbi:sigmaY antisigma factor component [Bacillus salacetis]|uniref:SigmaY antisigma factor component n=1 Tax=Bacillus salacetis TaxID=2315464 RepID=A0A3A1QTD8_9BACI|nr:sigmaY antisigma factor component [Bacillus salacetis]RIW30900.1 sigmaY antisigma factor component [Bacillus salacetis]